MSSLRLLSLPFHFQDPARARTPTEALPGTPAQVAAGEMHRNGGQSSDLGSHGDEPGLLLCELFLSRTVTSEPQISHL